MLVKGLLATEMSGSIAGITASHGRCGQYFRARAIPVNKKSVYQTAIRAWIASLASAWVSTLTAVQRSEWNTYGDAVSVIDRLGAQRKLTGLNWFVAMNIPRLQAGGARLDTAPTVLTMAAATPPTIVSATASTDVISLGFTNTDLWATQVGGKLLVYTAQPTNPSQLTAQTSYQYTGNVAGAVTPPTSPLPFTNRWGISVGQRIWIQTRAIQTDGRISAPFVTSAIAT